ncbi:hypothetical protein [uncultured Aquimarina sp.]|uniref:hypothetical protein n=1 Tax=uncultured Aquimarina sp. TaxID=575652 RepID=UPI00261A485C|nr:hypothetical protein [uncultured Aquimarina sp.]
MAFIVSFSSCRDVKLSNHLPNSDYSNFDLQNSEIDYFVKVNQLTDSTFQVIYRDTIAVSLNPTFHTKVLDLKINNQRLHEYPVLLLDLYRDLSYKKFQLLVTEFRKLLFQKFILKLDKGKYLLTRHFPIQPEESVFLDARIKENLRPPSLFKEFYPLFNQNDYVVFGLENKTVHIYDSTGKSIPDFTDYMITHKQFITFYKLEEKNTYQDYVYLISKIMKMLENINNSSSISEMEKDYKLILLNHSFLDYFRDN